MIKKKLSYRLSIFPNHNSQVRSIFETWLLKFGKISITNFAGKQMAVFVWFIIEQGQMIVDERSIILYVLFKYHRIINELYDIMIH